MSNYPKFSPGFLRVRGFVSASIIGFATLAFTGCGANLKAPAIGSDTSGITGVIHGGQQPVAFATVTLYAPGISGYGSAPSVLAATTSDANGNFTLTRPFTCVAGSPVTYIVASGGDSGGGANTSIGLAALLPACSDLTASTTVEINEVSTVAAAYALAPFATVASNSINIGTSAKNTLGLANALGPNSNLVDTATGIANAANSNANMVLPESEINTLADILASCVNTGPKVGGATSDACATLFTDATPSGGVVPSTTFQAALDIALNPGNNNALLFGRSTASAPFEPTLTSAPGDFALAIQYTGGQISGSGFTTGMAIDSQGNAWVGNGAGNTPKSVSKISPAGLFLSGTDGYLNGTAGGNGYSIDSSDNVFIAVAGANAIYELNPSGATVQTFTPASLNKPTGIAFDNRTTAFWISDSDNQPGLNNGDSDFTGTTVSYVDESTGLDASGSPYGAQNGPLGVEIDGLGNIWVANSAANNTSGSDAGFLSKFAPPSTAGNAYIVQNFLTGASSFPFELAFDSSNNVWTTLENAVAKFTNAGTLNGTYTSVATNLPASIMIDGLGRAFVSNSTDADFNGPGSLTVFSSTGTLLSTANANKGYLANNTINNEVFAPSGLGIDASGNVWITGINTSATAYGYVTELIGIAAPITTPTTVQSFTNTYGVRP